MPSVAARRPAERSRPRNPGPSGQLGGAGEGAGAAGGGVGVAVGTGVATAEGLASGRAVGLAVGAGTAAIEVVGSGRRAGEGRGSTLGEGEGEGEGDGDGDVVGDGRALLDGEGVSGCPRPAGAEGSTTAADVGCGAAEWSAASGPVPRHSMIAATAAAATTRAPTRRAALACGPPAAAGGVDSGSCPGVGPGAAASMGCTGGTAAPNVSASASVTSVRQASRSSAVRPRS